MIMIGTKRILKTNITKVKENLRKISKPKGPKTVEETDRIPYTITNARTATASIARLANPLFRLLSVHSGTKTKGLRLSSTTNHYSSRPREAKGTQRIVTNAIPMNDIIHINHYHNFYLRVTLPDNYL